MGLWEIVAAIGGAGVLFTVLVTGLGWVASRIIEKWMAERATKFTSDLQAQAQRDLAQLKSSLELAAFEHQTRFSRLHEKRAKIIGQLYSKVVNLHKAALKFVKWFNRLGDLAQEKNRAELWSAADAFPEYFERHRIYFNQELCQKLEQLNDTLSEASSTLASFEMNRAAAKISPDEEFTAWDTAMNTMEQEIPIIKRALEDNLRELLGVLEPGSHRQP